MNRWEIINYLTSFFPHCRYLEIGSLNKECFNKIKAEIKNDIDPYSELNPTYKVSSDVAFNLMPAEDLYDVIFIDGLHFSDQVLRDVYNSCKHLNDDGFIVLHDCNPSLEYLAKREIKDSVWFGDVYRAQMWLVKKFNDIVTIEDEFSGCGIIRGKIKFDLPCIEELLNINWVDFITDKKYSINLISWENLKLKWII